MRIPVLVIALAGTANASSRTVAGEVTAVTSRWTADGTRIVTEATVRTDTGDVTVSQLGGTVDGIGMKQWPGPERLVLGMRVHVAATDAKDLAGRAHVVVDSVKVDAYPPGYVRTGPTEGGKYLKWESGCVFVTLDSDGTNQIAGEAEFAIIENSINAWNAGGASCSYMQILSEGRKKMEVGRDRVNVIKFRDVSWCRPASDDDPARCHPESAAGITIATYVDDPSSDRDGALVDADIELNGVNFSIAVNDQTLGSQTCKSDLQNTLTHELGHLLGIEHTCLAPGDEERIDDKGNPVPDCPGTGALQEATMYNYQSCSEVKKQTLEADDVAALCGIYPIAEDPKVCEAVDDGGGCCEASPGFGGGPGRGSLLLSLLVGLALFAPFWRRRR